MTEIYGASDDLIEFDGDYRGEVGCYGTEDSDLGALIVCSDGTVLEIKYGKNDKAIWGINVIERGTLFDRLEICTDEDAHRHSDTVYINEGIKWIYVAKEDWELVR
jgi:hypothetical protein